jgi:hypothetical protein
MGGTDPFIPDARSHARLVRFPAIYSGVGLSLGPGFGTPALSREKQPAPEPPDRRLT